MEEVKRKRGRPRKGNGVGRDMHFRFDANRVFKLEMLLLNSSKTKTDVIMDALDEYYNNHKND